MTVRIRAIGSIIEWDAEEARMCIANPGDEVETGANLAAAKIVEGVAELAETGEALAAPAGKAQLAQLDHDGDGAPGGSRPHDPPALTGRNKEQLVRIAEAEGVSVPDGATNKQIVAAIEASRAAAAETGEAPAA